VLLDVIFIIALVKIFTRGKKKEDKKS
jgi:hypothetical protein